MLRALRWREFAAPRSIRNCLTACSLGVAPAGAIFSSSSAAVEFSVAVTRCQSSFLMYHDAERASTEMNVPVITRSFPTPPKFCATFDIRNTLAKIPIKNATIREFILCRNLVLCKPCYIAVTRRWNGGGSLGAYPSAPVWPNLFLNRRFLPFVSSTFA